jgi:YVTN family beta-propeller protein
VAVSPDGTRAYVANILSGSVSVIGTAAGQIIATIHGLCRPAGVAVSPDGTHFYVTNNMTRGTVAVITRQ